LYLFYEKAVSNAVVGFLFPAVYFITTQIYFPHYLPYFNCLVRPENGYKYLSGPNNDWGQDLKLLGKYLDKIGNPPVILSYSGRAFPEYYGIKYQDCLSSFDDYNRSAHINPHDVSREYFAVSVTNLQGVYYGRDVFKWLKKNNPVKRIGHSIFIYDITNDVETIVKPAEIYRDSGQEAHTRRQYKRLLYIDRDGSNTAWIEEQLKLLDHVE
jgi:hypothetical protein